MLRNVFAFLIIFSFVKPLHSQTPSTSIAFEERIHKFGTILEKNGKISHTFIFQNNGKTPAVLNEIYSSCGCIGRIISKLPIMPGKKGEVTIIFDPAYKSGFFSKEMVVLSNNSRNYNRIWVEGTIKPAEHPIEEDYPYNFGNGLYLRLKVMAFGYVKPGETKQMELHFVNATDKEMNLKFAIEDNKEALKFTNPGKIAPNAKGVILFNYTMPYVKLGEVTFYLQPYINNKKAAQTLEVKILNANKLTQKRSLF